MTDIRSQVVDRNEWISIDDYEDWVANQLESNTHKDLVVYRIIQTLHSGDKLSQLMIVRNIHGTVDGTDYYLINEGSSDFTSHLIDRSNGNIEYKPYVRSVITNSDSAFIDIIDSVHLMRNHMINMKHLRLESGTHELSLGYSFPEQFKVTRVFPTSYEIFVPEYLEDGDEQLISIIWD